MSLEINAGLLQPNQPSTSISTNGLRQDTSLNELESPSFRAALESVIESFLTEEMSAIGGMTDSPDLSPSPSLTQVPTNPFCVGGFEVPLSTTPINVQQSPSITAAGRAYAGQATSMPTTENLSNLIQDAATRYQLPANLLQSVIQQESSFKPNAVSSAGAMGLMQLMPGTAKALGVTNAFDPAQNIDGGAKYLRQLLNQFGGNVKMALAAYNAGPGAVEKYQGVPPYQETQSYVTDILSRV